MRRPIDNLRTATCLSQEEPKPASAAVSPSVNFLICPQSAVPLPSAVAMHWLGSSLSSSHSIWEQSHWSVSPPPAAFHLTKAREVAAPQLEHNVVFLSQKDTTSHWASRASKNLCLRQTVALHAHVHGSTTFLFVQTGWVCREPMSGDRVLFPWRKKLPAVLAAIVIFCSLNSVATDGKYRYKSNRFLCFLLPIDLDQHKFWTTL